MIDHVKLFLYLLILFGEEKVSKAKKTKIQLVFINSSYKVT